MALVALVLAFLFGAGLAGGGMYFYYRRKMFEVPRIEPPNIEPPDIKIPEIRVPEIKYGPKTRNETECCRCGCSQDGETSEDDK